MICEKRRTVPEKPASLRITLASSAIRKLAHGRKVALSDTCASQSLDDDMSVSLMTVTVSRNTSSRGISDQHENVLAS